MIARRCERVEGAAISIVDSIQGPLLIERGWGMAGARMRGWLCDCPRRIGSPDEVTETGGLPLLKPESMS